MYWVLSKIVMEFLNLSSEIEKSSSVLLIFSRLYISLALFLINKMVNSCFFLFASTNDLTKLFFFTFPSYQQLLKTSMILIIVDFWLFCKMLMKTFLVLMVFNFYWFLLIANFLMISLTFFFVCALWYFSIRRITLPFLS